jgi:hypothetical protein
MVITDSTPPAGSIHAGERKRKAESQKFLISHVRSKKMKAEEGGMERQLRVVLR